MVFAVQDPSLIYGTFAFYSAAAVAFDNLQITDINSAPMIGLSYPRDDSVVVPSTFYLSAIAANAPSNSRVEMLLDGFAVDSINEPPYTTQLTSVSQGYHQIEAVLYDGDDIPVAFDQNINVGVVILIITL